MRGPAPWSARSVGDARCGVLWLVAAYGGDVQVAFSGPVWEWRGPAPYHFVTVPDDDADRIKDVESMVTYGWGMIPVTVTIGATRWTTSLWPRNGAYVVPLKDAIRRAERISLGDTVTVRLDLDL